jgi:peptidoglycan/LPS O-acetylase OafA/YrhL
MAIMAAPATRSTRIKAFDGLRGIAAAIVVVFHYICLLHPSLAPGMSADSHWLTYTPAHILWNGSFWVAVFFVLSGFVMAAAASRRADGLLSSAASRYLRLALPATVSCLIAWAWLIAFPDSAAMLRESFVDASQWLNYTYQGEIQPVHYAVADGMVGSFARGYSRFNNVLWTMKIELLGSMAIFLIYAIGHERVRLLALVGWAIAIIFWFSEVYLGFALGAALYEAHRRELLQHLPAVVSVAALGGAFILGGVGEGAHLRIGLPQALPEAWYLGQPTGGLDGLAAALLLFAVLTLPSLGQFLVRRVPLFLGRISFGLYLVHVPPLYTIVAWGYLQGVPEIVFAPLFGLGVIVLAWLFTVLVDEPLLSQISDLRSRMARVRVHPAQAKGLRAIERSEGQGRKA